MCKSKPRFSLKELLIAGAVGLGLLVSASSASAAPASAPSSACKNLLKSRFNRNYALSNLESDGPYPGVTKLQGYRGQGANSTKKWVADGEKAPLQTLQRSWVQCAPGKIALGGGFSRADESPELFKGLQIVTSRPAQFCNNAEVGVAIPGDAAGSIVPNAWLVEGFNNNVHPIDPADTSSDLIVRPWVVCVTLNPIK